MSRTEGIEPKRNPLFLVAPLIAGACVLLICRSRVELLDDAFISFRYALNLAGGNGLVFNPGEPVEGYSNFLWTLCDALWIHLNLSPETMARILGALFGLGGLVLLTAWIGGPRGAVTAAVLAFSPVWVRHSLNGMETSCFAFWVLAALVLADRKSSLWGLAAGLAALTRFEGGLFFILIALYCVFINRARGQEKSNMVSLVAWGLVLFLLLTVPHNLWRVFYYGEFLPNTYFAKKATLGMDLSTGGGYLFDLLAAYPFLPLAVLAVFNGRRWRGLLGIAAVYLAYVWWVGGDSFDNFRFVFPVLFLLAALICQGVIVLVRAADGTRTVRYALVLCMILVFLGIQIRGLAGLEAGNLARLRGAAQVAGGKLAPGQSLATPVAGIVGFLNPDLIIRDTVGITDPVLARAAPDPRIRIKGHQKHDAAYILDQIRPDGFLPIVEVIRRDGGFEFRGEPFDLDILEHPGFCRMYRPLFWTDQEGVRSVLFLRKR